MSVRHYFCDRVDSKDIPGRREMTKELTSVPGMER